MDGILACLGRSADRRFRKQARECEDAKLKTRYSIALSLNAGRSAAETPRVLEVSIRTVYRVRQRFLQNDCQSELNSALSFRSSSDVNRASSTLPSSPESFAGQKTLS